MTTPNLSDYDYILLSSSGGKDSQAMIDHVRHLADSQGVSRDRLVVVHADLGRVEWQGTGELAEKQAAHYGLRFEKVSRIGRTAPVSGKTYQKGEEYGDLLDYVERRKMWPDSGNRYCTSDFKRGPIQTMITRLSQEHKATHGKGAKVRVLNCMGLRAQESPARAKKVPFENDKRNTNGSRHVDVWLPILDWKEDQVWETIKASGAPYHRAYDLGMPRLSCVFCIFAPKAALTLAGKHNPDLLLDYAAVEEEIGHTFRQDVSMADIVEAVANDETGDAEGLHGCWNM